KRSVDGLSSRRTHLKNPLEALAASAVVRVTRELLREHGERAVHETDHSVRVPAGAAPGDKSSEPLELETAVATLFKVHRIRDRCKSVEARAALPGALMREVLDHPRAFGGRARRGWERDDHAGAEDVGHQLRLGCGGR